MLSNLSANVIYPTTSHQYNFRLLTNYTPNSELFFVHRTHYFQSTICKRLLFDSYVRTTIQNCLLSIIPSIHMACYRIAQMCTKCYKSYPNVDFIRFCRTYTVRTHIQTRTHTPVTVHDYDRNVRYTERAPKKYSLTKMEIIVIQTVRVHALCLSSFCDKSLRCSSYAIIHTQIFHIAHHHPSIDVATVLKLCEYSYGEFHLHSIWSGKQNETKRKFTAHFGVSDSHTAVIAFFSSIQVHVDLYNNWMK